MKVLVKFTVDIDPDAWEICYGVSGAENIRADVRVYCENGVRGHLAELDLLKEA